MWDKKKKHHSQCSTSNIMNMEKIINNMKLVELLKTVVILNNVIKKFFNKILITSIYTVCMTSSI